MDHLGLGWQLRGHLLFGAAQQERFDPCVEVLQALVVALAFDRCAVIAVEGLGITQPAR
ncbi:hypothetical protein D3C78_853500 [compost metagenome]